MRPYAAALAAAALVLTGCASGAVDERPDEEQTLPQPLPELTLDAFGSDAEPLQLADVRGPAVINLWASWCGPCRKEMPILEELQQSDAGVEVIGVDFQDARTAEAQELVERTGVTYPLYEDYEGELNGLDPFPAMRGLPFLAFVDEEGRVVHQEFVIIDDLAEIEGLVREHLGVEA